MNRPWILIIILSVLFGFSAGIVGELWVNNLLMNPYVGNKSFYDLYKKIDELIDNQEGTASDITKDKDLAIIGVAKKAQLASVAIYRNKTGAGLGSAFVKNDLFGSGLILTTDGWILTRKQNMSTGVARVVVINGQKYAIEQKVFDSATDAVFIKIDAKDLSVADLGSLHSVNTGQTAMVVLPDKIWRTEVEQVGFYEAVNSATLVHSTEKFYKNIKLKDQIASEYLGAPVVGLDGKIFGILMNADGLVLPIDYLYQPMKQVVKSGTVERNALGVKYVDLSEAPIVEGLDQGASVYSFIKLVPELQVGDVILKVNDEEVNYLKSLTKLVQDYEVGDELKFLVQRGDEELKIEIKL